MLFEDEEHQRKATRSGTTLCILYIMRIIINLVVLITLVGSGLAIYKAVRLSLKVINNIVMISKQMKKHYSRRLGRWIDR